MAEKALQSTVLPIGYVDPKQVSKSSLTKGVYSLNKRSTVPFVQLRGTAGFQKTISWGEVAEIPTDQSCVVINDSYHGGDIFLNKGADPCNRPSRITVPVRGVYSNETGLNVYLRCIYPCDTRGARRAYLSIDGYVNQTSLDVTTRSRKLDGSLNTGSYLQYIPAPYGPGVGLISTMTFLNQQLLTMIPLGYGAVPGDNNLPHVLLDATDAFIFFTALSGAIAFPAYFPTGSYPSGAPNPPGMFYTVEYD